MANYYLGVDMGGTLIKIAIVDDKANVIEEAVVNTDINANPKSVIENITEVFKKFKHYNRVKTIGIGIAGDIDFRQGIVRMSPNLPKWNKVQLKRDIEKITDKIVYVDNDANTAAIGAYWLDIKAKADNMICVTLGTGVGGGIIVNGRLLKGKSGAGGEMHFVMSRHKKRSCTCGFYDCFEAYASGNGLRRTGVEIFNNENITTYDIIEKAKNGDKNAILALDTWQNDIALGIVGLANIFDPDCFVLSGSMEKFVDTDKIEEFVNKNIVTTPTKVFHARAGNNSGMIGAVLLGCEKFNVI